ncbi:hypothetical protein M432DRAFT_589788 [Thermoascus aurantiacus ATCC 26904]
MKIFAAAASVLAFAGALLASPSLASPLPNPDEPIRYVNISDPSFLDSHTPLAERSGYHYAHIAFDYNCGANYKFVENFGCGGTCYTGFQALSILLHQDGAGNPKPTGSMFSSSDCTGSYQSVGIASGQLDGCTNKQGGGYWQSAYLYFNC